MERRNRLATTSATPELLFQRSFTADPLAEDLLVLHRFAAAEDTS